MSRSKSRSRANARALDQHLAVANAGLNMFARVPNTPLPKTLKVKMVYSDYPSLNIGAGGAPATHVYRASDLYDPDLTGVGGQPRGFDQLMTLYDHFVVIGSKITVKLGAVAATQPVFFSVNLKDTGSADANIETTTESAYACWDLVNPYGPSSTLVQTYSPKFLGRSKPLSDPDLKGSDSASPAENAFYHVVVGSPTATDEAVLAPFVVIEYTAILIEPKRPPAS